MCYSALVKQELHNLARKFGAEIAWEMFADVFRRRLEQGDVKLSRALENNFDQPAFFPRHGLGGVTARDALTIFAPVCQGTISTPA